MALQPWRRVGRKSGPANLLAGRYEVIRVASRRWGVLDRSLGRRVGNSYGHRLMADARQEAERIHARARL